MANIFSTREIATGIWLIVIFAVVIVLAITSLPARRSIVDIIKNLCNGHFVISFALILAYAALLTFFLIQLPIWKNPHYKDVIVWVLFVGVPMCYGAVITEKNNYFRDMLIDNLKFTVIVEFIISTFTFSLLAEIIILPVLSLLVLMGTYCESKGENLQVKKFISVVLAITGFIILGGALKVAIKTYAKMGMMDSLVGFSIPIVLSVAYIPVAYIFGLYANYQTVFVNIRSKKIRDGRIRKKYKCKVFCVCGMSYRKISKFKNYTPKIHAYMTENEFDSLIEEFKATTGKPNNVVACEK